MDTIRCSSYAPELTTPARCSPRCAAGCSRNSRQPTTDPRPRTLDPRLRPAAPRKPTTPKPEMMHHGVTGGEGARLEVRVRPAPNNKTRSRSNESKRWEEIFKCNEKTLEPRESSFENFDPLRTLHFLIQELSTRLQRHIPRAFQQLVCGYFKRGVADVFCFQLIRHYCRL